MLVQPSRTATVCEVDRARKRAASRKRAQNLGYRTNRWRLITRKRTTRLSPAHVRIARRSLTLRPAHSRRHLYVTCYTEGFSHFVTSMTAPVASGWSILRVGLAPTGKRRLSRRTREAAVADRGGRRRRWTDSGPTWFAGGGPESARSRHSAVIRLQTLALPAQWNPRFTSPIGFPTPHRSILALVEPPPTNWSTMRKRLQQLPERRDRL